jgi:hypothetical protein
MVFGRKSQCGNEENIMDSGCDLLSAVTRLAGTGGIDFISKN